MIAAPKKFRQDQRGFLTPMPFSAGYRVDSADFDGSNDYLLRGGGLTGAADSKTGIFSAWIRIDSDTPAMFIFGSVNFRFQVSYDDATDKFEVYGITAADATALELRTASTYTSGATWRHLLVAWDVATAALHLYMNDVSDLDGGSTSSNLTIDYTETDWAVGAETTGSSKFNGCLAELYFAPGQYLDISIEANRRKFIRVDGSPADLGATGSAPTGVAPLVCCGVARGAAVASFATNRGTGGNFSITGTLTAGSTSPSD